MSCQINVQYLSSFFFSTKSLLSGIYTLVFTTTNWRSFFTRIKCPSSVCFTVRTVFLELHSSSVQNIFFKRKFLKDYLQLFGFQSHTFLFFIFILVVFTNILLKLKCSFSVFIFVLLHKWRLFREGLFKIVVVNDLAVRCLRLLLTIWSDDGHVR